jgi:hypothetical protein
MLRILADGPFVPKEIKNSRNYYDILKKKRNANNTGTLHSNISNKKTNFITNNINNYTSLNNNKKYINKDINEDYLNTFIENIIQRNNKDNKNCFKFTFQNKSDNICNNSSININNNDISIKKKLNKDNSNELNIVDNNNFTNNLNKEDKINDISNNKYVIESYNLNENNNMIKPNEKGKIKIKYLNCSLDDIYNNNERYMLEDNKRNIVNSSVNDYRTISLYKNKKRVNSLSNKLKKIKNFEKYNTLINNRKIKKAGLEKSVSNLENSIKIFRNDKKLKEKECIKLSLDNKKLIINNTKNQEKIKDYYIMQNIIKEKNNEFIKIKNINRKINEEIMKYKNEIEEINLNIKLLNKKMINDAKICDKMRKDINIYKKHSEKLKQKLNIFDENADVIEDIINKMKQKHK